MKKILILGGDKRNAYLKQILIKEGYDVISYGIEENIRAVNNIQKENILRNNDEIKSLLIYSDVIISYIPFSKNKIIICDDVDGSTNNQEFIMENLNKNFYDQEKFEDDFLKCSLNDIKNKIFIAGNIDKKVVLKLQENNNKVIDLIKIDALAKLNAIPTAEGVIKVIIDNTDFTIHNSNIAILGFGRIGKQVAKSLNCLGARIYVYEINKNEVANISFSGYNILNELNDNLNDMDVVINTVPSKILNKIELLNIRKDALVVDVASNPGGVDFEFAKFNQNNVIHELGIPGKVAPKTAAIYIKKIIEDYLK